MNEDLIQGLKRVAVQEFALDIVESATADLFGEDKRVEDLQEREVDELAEQVAAAVFMIYLSASGVALEELKELAGDEDA